MAVSLRDLPKLDQLILQLLDEGKTELQIALEFQISIPDLQVDIFWLRLVLLVPQETPVQDIVRIAREQGSLVS